MAKKVIKNDELIDVMNYTVGELIYVNPRTQEQWTWNGFGDIQPIPFIELKTIKSSYPKFVYEPWFVIMNDNVVESLALNSFYEKIIKPDEFDNFYKMNTNDMANIIEKAPDNMKLVIAQLTKDKIKKGQFGDLFKIKLIEDLLKVNLIENDE